MHAGTAIQVEARREILSEPVNSSSVPRTMPAGTPRKMTPRKTKQSPAVTTAFVPGMCAGSIPEMTTRLIRTRSCAHCTALYDRHAYAPHPSASAPAATSAAQ